MLWRKFLLQKFRRKLSHHRKISKLSSIPSKSHCHQPHNLQTQKQPWHHTQTPPRHRLFPWLIQRFLLFFSPILSHVSMKLKLCHSTQIIHRKGSERSMKRSENKDSMIDAIRRRFFLLNFHFSSVDDSRHSARLRGEKRKIQKSTNSLAKLEPDWRI